MLTQKGIILALLVASGGVAFADDERIERLEKTLNEVKSELSALKGEDAGPSVVLDAPRRLESFAWGLLLEAEGSYAKNNGEEESDLVLATVEFVVDAAVNRWLRGHVCLLWEEDDTEPLALDEAVITVGSAFYVQAGKYYLPFGNFESAFVSDPLTLELAEINTSSALTGYGNEWFDVGVGAFKGDDEDVVDTFYAAANCTVSDLLVCGAYWLSDLLETDGLADLNDDLDQREGGAGLYANLYVGPVVVNTEVVGALNSYDIAGAEYQPLAYSVETSVLIAEKWMVGVKYEGSDDFYAEFDGVALEGQFHDEGYGAVVAYGFHENAAISTEYMRLVYHDEEGDQVTVQLALEI